METKLVMNFHNATTKKWRAFSSNEKNMFMEKMMQTTYRKKINHDNSK
jgi:hypothetical protein